MSSSQVKPRKIVFVHPDLGIGGAERLIIDAAVGLQSLGHKVTILTSYCNPSHCFIEARDGTLDVRVRGDGLFPPTIAGRLKIVFSILRQISLVVGTGVLSDELRKLDPDVFIVDQLSACVPFFRTIRPEAKVLFYGHYPDRLLMLREGGLLGQIKRLYRVPFDLIESWSTGCSDSIVVNSKYTRSVFKQTFPSMRSRELKVIYPCVDTEVSNSPNTAAPIWKDKKYLLSINRFERKKNLDLALQAYVGLSPTDRSQAKLVLAGGYDPRNAENSICHKQLQQLAKSLGLEHETFRAQDATLTALSEKDVDVFFLLSVPDKVKSDLLQAASLLVYTPENEHFGIVPLEAMLVGVPVLATNTGGPLETIYDGRTGFLRAPDKVEKWTEVMRKPLIPSTVDSLKAMGQKGRERVLNEFSRSEMSKSFDREIQRIVQSTGPRPVVVADWVYVFFVIGLVAAMAFVIGKYSAKLLLSL